MHTPTHAILNLALLDRRGGRRAALAVLAGAVLPDLPSLFFYFLYRVVLGLPEEVIWGDLAARPLWRLSTIALHAVPLLLVALAIAAWRRSPAGLLFCASLALHL